MAGEDRDRHIDLLYQPIRDQQGSVIGIFVGGYDVTERFQEQDYRNAPMKLTDTLADLREPGAIEIAAAEILGTTLNVSRVGHGTIDPVAETLQVLRDWNERRAFPVRRLRVNRRDA